MGLLDKLRGVKRPDDDAQAVSRAELERRLHGLNHPEVPFTVAAAPDTEDADLVAEWKIVDAEWYEIFAKAGLEKNHRIYLAFNEQEREVRALEEAWEVEWRAGVPSFRLSMEKQQGRSLGSFSFGSGYAFKGVDPRSFGEVYNYRFNVSEMKDPLIETITESGWTYTPVMLKGRLR
jgi:hypothetical protein